MNSWGKRAGGTITGLCLAATLCGCAASGLSEAEAPAPTPTVATTPSPMPTPNQTTCDTAFTADFYMKIAEDGLTVLDTNVSSDADRLVGTDGLRCRWTKPHTDITVGYATWSRDVTAWESLKTDLLADGYVETGRFAVSRPVSEFDSAFSYRDGVIHYVSPSSFIDWVTALQ